MSKPTVISTFAGCGGSSLGYKWAGFKELLAVEWDDHAVECFKLNFPEVPVYHGDIAKLSVDECLELSVLKKGELDVFDGSPPCQGFSTAGKRQVSDDRNDLFKEYCRLLEGLQPKVFVMENVKGMIQGKMKGRFLEILQSLKDCGYQVKCKLMNAMWYEVPQSRERVIFIGVRKDLDIEITYPEKCKDIITITEAWKEVVNKTFVRQLGRLGKIVWNHIKQGQNGSAYRKNYYFNTTKLALNKPSPTLCKNINGVGGMFHPIEQRTITIEEMKRIASFPDEFRFLGTPTQQWARIGNSVPPKMMYHIAKHIKETILDHIRSDGSTYTEVKDD